MIEILKSGVVAGMAVLGLAGASGVAVADGVAAEAPYAQVAAEVQPDGTIVMQRGVKYVTRTAVGRYCVAVEDPGLNLAATIPFAALAEGEGFARILRPSGPNCNGDLRSYSVSTYDENGVLLDGRFRVFVP
ncbi:hypothetical protein [Acrocarpospora sp. B8E8]|uniref:hypothetical protein n=1 Tax=Acrocarpospora sp. B8E8 TaxID=3153572 RepID=UPI00325D4DB7